MKTILSGREGRVKLNLNRNSVADRAIY